MGTIWKFPIDMDGFVLTLSSNARVVHVAMQGDQPCVWIQHHPEAGEQLKREFRVFGTGHPIPNEWCWNVDAGHVGSWQDGPFVWHLYWKRGDQL